MRKADYEFLVDGRPILVPDAGVVMTEADVEAPGSGYDALGVYHRVVLRRVRSWRFGYGVLCSEENAYLRELFRRGDSLEITFPGDDGTPETARGYVARWEVTLENRAGDLLRGLTVEVKEN